MGKAFVERRPAGFYLAGTRIPIDSIVRDYWSGETVEAMCSHFPAAGRDRIEGALDFYLANREEVDSSIAEREQVERAFRASHPAPEALKRRVEQARAGEPAK